MRYYLDEVQSTCEEEIKDEGQELQDAEKLFLEDSQSTDIIDCPRNSSFVHQEGDVPTLLSSRVPEAAALPVYQKRASYGTSACKQVGEVPRDHRSLPGGEVKDKRDPLFESLLCVSSVEMNSVSFPGWLEGTRRSEGTGGGGNIWLGPGRRYSFLGSSLCRLERRVFPKALRFMFTNHSLLACGHPSRVDKFSEKRREGGVVSGKTDLQGSVRKALRDSKEGKGGEQDFLLAPPERFSLRLPGERGDSQKKQEENGEGEEEKRRSTSNRREMQRGRRKRNRKRQRKRKKRSQKS
ncbi:hypothetical protein CSUI_002071 [Cystoisospora suis]|uniref:Uncharacterized protein n=1 Tax=Cystoisospora suis TaxID=483139 RepID=A0A2C6LA64_9APIC|nr:hypothetical protein CSUI_002071 [Cystoisospora suis]